MVTELPDDPLFYGQVNKNWWASISEACDKNLISFYCSSLAFLSTDRRQKRLTYLKGKKEKKKMSNITTCLYYIMLLFWDLKWVSCKLKDSHLGCKNFWSHCFVYCRGLLLFFLFFYTKVPLKYPPLVRNNPKEHNKEGSSNQCIRWFKLILGRQ